MNRFFVIIPAIGAMFFISGCADELRKEMIQRDESFQQEISQVQDKTLTTENRLDEISNLLLKMNENNNQNFDTLNSKIAGLQKEINSLQKQDDKIAAEIETRDKKTGEKLKIILDEVLNENQKIIKRIRTIETQVYGEAQPEPVVEKTKVPAKKSSAPSFTPSGAGAEGDYTQHTVKSGENLWVIAQNYGVSMEDIVQANNMESISDVIRPGQTLRIPVRK